MDAEPIEQLAQAKRLRPRLRALASDGVYFGTSSWKYDGWLGSIYSPDRYITLGRREFIAQRVLFTTDGRHVVTLNSNGTLFVLRLREWPP